MTRISLSLVRFLATVSLWLAGGIGWVLNIVHVCHANFDVLTLKLALQLIGIVSAPLGAIVGWIF